MYASAMKLSGIYTPQAVINGQKEMVGSDDAKISSAVSKFQNELSTSQLTITGTNADEKNLTINFNTEGETNNTVLNIALVENKATTSIKAGENDGVTLTNYNVVRNFRTLKFDNTLNKTSISLVDGIDKNNLSVILFLQDAKTNKIISAAKSSL